MTSKTTKCSSRDLSRTEISAQESDHSNPSWVLHFWGRHEFLVFEQGPSVSMTLEWATYRDASDQCSLSRIWGGIHPPADDIPGRLIGAKIGPAGFAKAKAYFNGE